MVLVGDTGSPVISTSTVRVLFLGYLTAELWSKQFQITVAVDDVWCDGCLVGGNPGRVIMREYDNRELLVLPPWN